MTPQHRQFTDFSSGDNDGYGKGIEFWEEWAENRAKREEIEESTIPLEDERD